MAPAGTHTSNNWHGCTVYTMYITQRIAWSWFDEPFIQPGALQQTLRHTANSAEMDGTTLCFNVWYLLALVPLTPLALPRTTPPKRKTSAGVFGISIHLQCAWSPERICNMYVQCACPTVRYTFHIHIWIAFMTWPSGRIYGRQMQRQVMDQLSVHQLIWNVIEFSVAELIHKSQFQQI